MLKAFGREAVGIEWIEGIAGRVAIGTIRRLESFEREIGSRTSTLSHARARGHRIPQWWHPWRQAASRPVRTPQKDSRSVMVGCSVRP